MSAEPTFAHQLQAHRPGTQQRGQGGGGAAAIAGRANAATPAAVQFRRIDAGQPHVPGQIGAGQRIAIDGARGLADDGGRQIGGDHGHSRPRQPPPCK